MDDHENIVIPEETFHVQTKGIEKGVMSSVYFKIKINSEYIN